MKKDKKKKIDFEDDGRTIVDMNVDGFSWYCPTAKKQKEKKDDKDKPTKKEILALIGGAYKAMLPYALIMIGGFAAAFIIAMLWL